MSKGEGVGGGASESGNHFTVVEPAELFCGGFEDFIAQGDLAVAGHDDLSSSANAENCRRTDLLFHSVVFFSVAWRFSEGRGGT